MIVYTVIVTYNGLKNDWIKKSLQSLSVSTQKSNIVIVDNNSSDGTVQHIVNNFPEVFIIQNIKNKGFGKANNQGISHALNHNADYVFLLNQDAYVLKDTLTKLVAVAELNKDFGIISPIHLDGAAANVENDFLNFASPPNTKNLANDAFLNKVENKLYQTNFVNAAAWLVSKNCFRILGGFSPTFYHYGEDNNFCHRAQFHTVSIGIYPHAFVLHDRDQMSAEHADLSERMFRDKLVEWANPNKKEVIKFATLRLFINYLLYKYLLQNTSVANASIKLFKYKIYQFSSLQSVVQISKNTDDYKFLNYKYL